MNPDTVFAAPTRQVLEDLIAVAAGRTDPHQTRAGLRLCAWHSLLRQRRIHGSLAAARQAAIAMESRLAAAAGPEAG